MLASLEVALAYPERTDWPGAVTTAARQTRRLQSLAEDLLLLARLDARAPAAGGGSVDLAALASRLVEQDDLPDRPVTLTADTTRPGYMSGDADDHGRLLRNLVDNAARHASSRVRVTVRNQDGEVVLSVRDDGPGIPGEESERVFERFVRLDDARSRDRGGLGLPIPRELAHATGARSSRPPRMSERASSCGCPGRPFPSTSEAADRVRLGAGSVGSPPCRPAFRPSGLQAEPHIRFGGACRAVEAGPTACPLRVRCRPQSCDGASMLRIHFTPEDLTRVTVARGPDFLWEITNSVQTLQRADGEGVFGA